MLTVATVETASAKRYLGQFCKHFAHKLPVDLAEDNSSGTVGFSIGSCVLRADDQKLALALEGAEDAMTGLQDVVARHLVRFAFREELELQWQAIPS
jgi:hypothetical protein